MQNPTATKQDCGSGHNYFLIILLTLTLHLRVSKPSAGKAISYGIVDMGSLTLSLPKMSWWCCILLRLVPETCFSTIPSLSKMLSCWCRILPRLVPGTFFFSLSPSSHFLSTTPSLPKLLSCWCRILPRLVPETWVFFLQPLHCQRCPAGAVLFQESYQRHVFL